MNRPVRYLILLGILAFVCWLFPLFHIVPLKTALAEKAAVTFNPAAFAEFFWTNQLSESFSHAVPAETLVHAIAADSATAKKKYSRSVGLGDAYFYFLSGSGTVTAVSDDEISLALTPGSTNADVVLEVELVFGNAIRDGTGLLNASDYPNSQDFNDLSAALNHLVETRILPSLKAQAKVGATLSFIGCVEVDDESSDLKPLKIIPLQVKVP
jgi:predicted lipoprotein